MSLNDLSEPRAKRTHARRSCEVCKVRKTRCELPDLDVPSSPHPLPLDKSCHRCRVLTIPCVVDDTNKKVRKRVRGEGASGAASADDSGAATLGSVMHPSGGGGGRGRASSPTRRRGKAPRVSTDSVGRNGVNHGLDILQGIQPALDWADAAHGHSHGHGHEDGSGPHDPFAVPTAYEPPEESIRTKSMKLHGRPLELVCAMLKVAYGKTHMRGGRKAVDDLDLDYLVDADLRRRLNKGFLQLKVLHPYLDPLPAVMDLMRSDDLGSQLLAAVVVYLCSIVLPSTADVVRFRAVFSEQVLLLRDRAMLALPATFQTIQAFELLNSHAPIGCLPLQVADLRVLTPTKGGIAAMAHLTRELAFANLTNGLARGPGIWDVSEPWLYFAVAVQEASGSLGDEVSKRPASLSQSQQLLDQIYDDASDDLWRTSGERLGPEGVLGRLAMCDRVSRLSVVFDSLDRLRGALETAASDFNYDVVEAIREELQYFTQRMADADQKHDRYLDLISRSTRGLEAGWTAYRGFRRRYETCKVYGIGLRYTVATSYLPGHPLAFPGLPNNLSSPLNRVSYALDRASTPADIIPFLMQNSPAVHSVWYWGTQRGNLCQATLSAFIDLERIIVPGGALNAIDLSGTLGAHLSGGAAAANPNAAAADLVPLHEITCCVVESAKILMEMQAGNIVVRRQANVLDRTYRPPEWLYLLKQASAVLRAVGTLPGEDEGLESFSNGCSNLIGSMVRMGEEWTKTVEAEFGPLAPADGTGEDNGGADNADASKPFGNGGGQDGNNPSIEPSLQAASGMPDGNGAGGYGAHVHDAATAAAVAVAAAAGGNGNGSGQAGHQAYMDTSDRWMAGSGDASANGGGNVGHAAGGSDGHSGSYVAHMLASHPVTAGQQTHAFNANPQEYPPTNLDLLLSQMFNYSGQPGSHGHPASHQQGQHQQQGQGQGQGQGQHDQGTQQQAHHGVAGAGPAEPAWNQVQ